MRFKMPALQHALLPLACFALAAWSGGGSQSDAGAPRVVDGYKEASSSADGPREYASVFPAPDLPLKVAFTPQYLNRMLHLACREMGRVTLGEESLPWILVHTETPSKAAQKPRPRATCGGGLCEVGNIPWCRACCNEIRDICYNDAYSAYTGCVAGCSPEDQECFDACYQNYLQARLDCYYNWLDCYFCCWQ